MSRYGIVAFASSLDQIGPLARDARDAAALLHAVAGRDDRDSTSAPVPVPDELLRLPGRRRRGGLWLKGKRLGLPAEYFVKGMEPGVEARIREAVDALEAAGADGRGGLAAAHRLRPRDVLHRRPGGGVGEPRPLRRRALRPLGPAATAATSSPTTSRPAARASGRRSSAGSCSGPTRCRAGYYDAFYLKAQKVRTLIKRDFDEVFESRHRRAGRADVAVGRVPVRGAKTADPVAMYLSDACTLPANMAGIAGVSSRAASPTGSRSASSSSARRGPSWSCCASAAPTRRSPPMPTGAAWSPRSSPSRTTSGPDAGRAGRGASPRLTPRPRTNDRDAQLGVDPELAALIDAEAGAPARRPSTSSPRRASRPAGARGPRARCSPPRPRRAIPAAATTAGTVHADAVEQLAIDRAKALFGADHANVQPSSGVNANLAVYRALLKPGDAVLALRLAHGGHLSHGDPASITGAVYRFEHYGVRADTETIDLDEVRDQARATQPRLIVTGGSSYPRAIDYAAFGEIAREVGARLLVDMAHVAGLVAAGELPSPVPHADAVTFTTYKTMLGPHGGVILAAADIAQGDRSRDLPGHPGRAGLRADRGEGRVLRRRGDRRLPRRPSARIRANAAALAAERWRTAVTGS